MTEDEVKKKIEIAGFVGAIFGFASGVALMTLVSIIFWRSIVWVALKWLAHLVAHNQQTKVEVNHPPKEPKRN